MPVAALICALLVFATTMLHYELLRGLSAVLHRFSHMGRVQVLLGIFGAFFAHLLEIALYALAYYFMSDHFGLGNFGGNFVDRFSTFLYFSAETFTSVGFGDLYPQGALRFVCGTEALNGLLLIGWSASFTYVYMARYWNIDEA